MRLGLTRDLPTHESQRLRRAEVRDVLRSVQVARLMFGEADEFGAFVLKADLVRVEGEKRLRRTVVERRRDDRQWIEETERLRPRRRRELDPGDAWRGRHATIIATEERASAV